MSERGDERVPGRGPDGPDPGELNEEILRQLLQDSALEADEPPAEVLEHIRKQIPVRRARRRHAAVCALAAVVVGGATIPALLHTNLVIGEDKPMHAASHSESQYPGKGGGGPGADGSGKGGDGTGADGEHGKGGASTDPDGDGEPGPRPSSSFDATMAPSCARDQLGGGTAEAEAPNEAGHVYGSFRVTNISTSACTIDGDGIITVSPLGRTDRNHLQVVDHTTGDPAVGLPAPSAEADELVLQPKEAYLVRFAWIPTAGGGPSGCVAVTTPPPGEGTEGGEGTMSTGGGAALSTTDGGTDGGPGGHNSGGTGTGGGGGGETGDGGEAGDGGENGDGEGGEGTPEPDPTTGGGTSSGGSGGGGTPEAGVSISHTPDVGTPVVADTVLRDACAGTVYRTGVLPVS